jgi:hypothetical protein
MLYFCLADDANALDLSQRELSARLCAIQADLAKSSQFPLGERSRNRWALQAMRNYWIGWRDGSMADLVKKLFDRIDRETAAQILALMKCELEEMKQGMPISAWSEQCLVDFMEEIQLLFQIGRHEEPEAELDC